MTALAPLNFGPGGPDHHLRQLGSPSDLRRGTLRPNWWHDHLIDYMLANPGCGLQELATYCQKTPAWISFIRGSDAFQARYEQRRRELNQELGLGVHSKLLRVADRALSVLDMKLEAVEASRGAGVGLETILEVADSALGRLGYGVKAPGPAPGTNVNVNVNSGQQIVAAVDPQVFQAARSDLRAREQALITEIATPPSDPQLLHESAGSDPQLLQGRPNSAEGQQFSAGSLSDQNDSMLDEVLDLEPNPIQPAGDGPARPSAEEGQR